MQKEKVRIFALARELGIESKDLLNLCRQNGIDVKNQLSTIEPEVRDQVVQLVQKQGSKTAPPPTPRVVPPLVTPKERVRILDDKPKVPPMLRPTPKPATPAETSGKASVSPASETPVSPSERTVPPMTSAPAAKAAESAPLPPSHVSPSEKLTTPPLAGKPVDTPTHPRSDQPATAPHSETTPRPETPPSTDPNRPPVTPPSRPTHTETRSP